MTVTVDIFRKLRTSKNLIRLMFEKSRIRGLFNKQHGKRAPTLLQSGRRHLYHIY